MPTPYTDADTERARQIEASSAGVVTQQLQLPNEGEVVPAARPQIQPLGVGLVGLGLLLLMSRLLSLPIDVEGGMVLLTIASIFFFFGFWKRIYGLIIPGSILAGLSVGIPFADLTDGVSVVWGLALGFLGIYFFGRTLFRQTSTWPVIPAVILFGVGMIVAASNLPSFLAAGMIWLPLLLIGAGLYLGFGRK